MFDIGFWELCVIGVIALVILGPERLPRVARTAGLWAGRARRFMSEVKADIDAELQREEIRTLKDVGEDLKQTGSDLASAGSELHHSLNEQSRALQESVQADSPNRATGEESDSDERR